MEIKGIYYVNMLELDSKRKKIVVYFPGGYNMPPEKDEDLGEAYGRI